LKNVESVGLLSFCGSLVDETGLSWVLISPKVGVFKSQDLANPEIGHNF